MLIDNCSLKRFIYLFMVCPIFYYFIVPHFLQWYLVPVLVISSGYLLGNVTRSMTIVSPSTGHFAWMNLRKIHQGKNTPTKNPKGRRIIDIFPNVLSKAVMAYKLKYTPPMAPIMINNIISILWSHQIILIHPPLISFTL